MKTLNEVMISYEEPVGVEPMQWGIDLGRHFKNNSDVPIAWKRIGEWYIMNGPRTHKVSTECFIAEKRVDRTKEQVKCTPETLGGIEVADLTLVEKIALGLNDDLVIAVDDRVYSKKLFSINPSKNKTKPKNAFAVRNKFSVGMTSVDQECYGKLVEIESRLPDNVGINFMPCGVVFQADYPHELRILDQARKSGVVTGDYFQLIGRTPVKNNSAMFNTAQAVINGYLKPLNKAGVGEIIPYLFCNQGRRAGATQVPAHLQIYLDSNQQGHGFIYEFLLQSQNQGSDCNTCVSDHDNRMLFENATWRSWFSSAPTCDYEIRFAPKRHVERFTDLTSDEVDGLSELLKVCDLVLTELGVLPDRNFVIKSLPYGYDSRFHLIGELIPFRYIGGAERGYSVSIAYKDPDKVAVEGREKLKLILDRGFDSNDYTYK